MDTYFATLFENHRKSLIQHCEQLRLHLELTKVNQKCQMGRKYQIEKFKWDILSDFQTIWEWDSLFP